MKRTNPAEQTTQPTLIDPSAVIGKGAKIGDGVSVGPYAIVGPGAQIGDGSRLAGHSVVGPGTVLGSRTTVHSFAVVGGDPQDLGFDTSTNSTVHIGDDVVIREGVTVSRATRPDGLTTVGNGTYLMANSHIGHDCHVGDRVILANNVMLAGHVNIGDACFLGGGAGMHQFARVGEGAMVGGNASISYDVPPHTIAAERNCLIGLNLVGLRRRAVDRVVIADLKHCLRTIFWEPGDVRRKASAAIAAGKCGTTATGAAFLAFCEGGERGFVALRRKPDCREQTN